MIIDFQFPTLTTKGWAVDVHKALKDGRIFIQQMKFEDKDDAIQEVIHAENVPQPIKLYVCPDGSVYDNESVAKSHTASIFNPLPAGATTTDRVYLEQELDRTKKQLEIAIDALNEIDKNLITVVEMTWRAKMALERINDIDKGEQQ